MHINLTIIVLFHFFIWKLNGNFSCPLNCNECNDDNDCSSCNIGFEFNANDNTCKCRLGLLYDSNQ